MLDTPIQDADQTAADAVIKASKDREVTLAAAWTVREAIVAPVRLTYDQMVYAADEVYQQALDDALAVREASVQSARDDYTAVMHPADADFNSTVIAEDEKLAAAVATLQNSKP